MVELSQLMKLMDSNSENAWSNALFEVAHGLGFESVLYAALPSKHANLETSFLHSNYSQEWRQHYDSEKLHYVDPTVSHCLGSVLPLVWEPGTFNQKDQSALYEE